MKACRGHAGPRTIGCSILAVVLSVAGMIGSSPVYADQAADQCREVELPVALDVGQPRDQSVVGTLCRPRDNPRHEVDVLVHGSTYTRLYWDFPFDSPNYSFVDRTLQQGRATFAFDLIGAGESSKPPSASVTNVFVVHQIIQWLRTENDFRLVNLFGHSLGSATAIAEAATYRDVDRLVVTSFLHQFTATGIAPALGATYPAVVEEKFRRMGLDPGYITTVRGQRGRTFYNSNADPGVIQKDEDTKSVVSLREVSFSFQELLTPPALNSAGRVTARVLTIVGADDRLFCGPPDGLDCGSEEAIVAHERAYYRSAASLTARVVPNTDHSLTLHRSAQRSFDLINDWIREQDHTA